MCRLLGYLGRPVPLASLVFDPPFSLERQSHAPRHQDLGRINADGWGVAWYQPDGRDEPGRYRTATPMWADERFRDAAAMLTSGCVVAAVRNASPGAPVEETGSSPFVADRWAFTHNGFVTGFRGELGVELRRRVSPRRDAAVLGAADSEVVFALVLDRIDAGDSADDALLGVLHHLDDVAGGRFNTVLADGERLLATCWGNTLFVRTDDHGTVVASEPYDDDPGWDEVPDRSLVVIDGSGPTTRPC